MHVSPLADSNDGLPAPAGWWGPIWTEPHPRTLIELVKTGVMDATTAAMLWTLVESGQSLTVAAGPSGAGKTTLLTSLLDALPDSRHRYYVRGLYERFDTLRSHPAASTTLLVNEISPHLPIYAWGSIVREILEASMDGYQVLATMHARSADQIVGQLGAYPLRIPPRLIVQLGTVVFLDAWQDGPAIRRRVDRVVGLSYDERHDAVMMDEVPGATCESGLIDRRASVIKAFEESHVTPDSRTFASAMRDVL